MGNSKVVKTEHADSKRLQIYFVCVINPFVAYFEGTLLQRVMRQTQ